MGLLHGRLRVHQKLETPQEAQQALDSEASAREKDQDDWEEDGTHAGYKTELVQKHRIENLLEARSDKGRLFKDYIRPEAETETATHS